MNANLTAICRLCLQSGEQLQDFFDPHENFVTIVEEFTGLEIVQESSFPSNVCCTCLAHIDTLNNFKKTCLQSEKSLREGLVIFEIRIVDDKLKSEEHCDEAAPTQDVKVFETDAEQPKIESHEARDPLDVASNFNPKPVRKKARTKSEKQLETAAPKKLKMNKKPARKLKIESDEAATNLNPKPPRKKKKTPCHICGKLYTTTAINYHLNMHSGLCPFVCPFKDCDKAFSSPASLKKHHIMSHSDQYSFACDVCGRPFKFRNSLNLHRSYHFDPELPCSVCGKLLRHSKALKKHMITHTGERPYPCNECTKSFQTNYTLRIHQRVHTKEKPFTCAICGKSFSYKCLLRTHITSSHPETES